MLVILLTSQLLSSPLKELALDPKYQTAKEQSKIDQMRILRGQQAAELQAQERALNNRPKQEVLSDLVLNQLILTNISQK